MLTIAETSGLIAAVVVIGSVDLPLRLCLHC